MFTISHRTRLAVAVATGLTTSIGLALVGRRLCSKMMDSLVIRSPKAKAIVAGMTIQVAKTEEQTTQLVEAILLDIKESNVLGFDCEWVQKEERRPVALLQLASQQGRCALFQLCLLSEIPQSLKDLLEDRNILKVGIDPLTDSHHLQNDYGINVVGTFDIRHISPIFPKMGLAAIVQRELDISLPKSFSIRTSNWESSFLSDQQLRYAALDALSSVLVFNCLIYSKVKPPFFSSKENTWSLIRKHCEEYIDVRFIVKNYPSDFAEKSSSHSHPLQKPKTSIPHRTTLDSSRKKYYRAYTFRKAPLYHNCLLLAPDGEALCTCDTKKANWYVSKGLASVESSDPYSVRLLFEPSGRAEGISGQYYIHEKENQCVVCGRKESYMRKMVVPHEYRRYMPDSMKSHQSHDVVLLCAPCHLQSNSSDVAIRLELARLCDAPLDSEDNMKVTEDRKRKQLRSAARALLKAGDKLPKEREKELKAIILDSCAEVTSELLNELKDLDINIVNDDYTPHGRRVIEYFAKEGVEGLRRFEKLWRQHFLQTMKPHFLPPFWSVDHNHEDKSR